MAPPLAAFAQHTAASPSGHMRCRTAAKEGEGDVMLMFKGDELPHLMVNARVLSNASPVFRAMLATNYSDECLRSASDPQILEGVECEQCDMWLLCLLLHGHNLNWPAGVDDYDLLVMLAGMSVLAVKFDAVEHMKKAISPRLLGRFKKRVALPAKDEERACSRDALLAMIAHKLDQEDTFCLFSRRMILDHSFRLSDLDPNILNQFPPLTLLRFEEQRVAAKEVLNHIIRKTATRTCTSCSATQYIPSVISAIGNKLSPKLLVWPPNYEEHTVRQVLIAIHSLGKFRIVETSHFQICHEHWNPPVQVNVEFRDTARAASRHLTGLYFVCREDRPHFSNCRHLEPIRDMIAKLDTLE